MNSLKDFTTVMATAHMLNQSKTIRIQIRKVNSNYNL